MSGGNGGSSGGGGSVNARSSTQVGPAHGKVTALVDGKVVKGNPRSIVLKAHELIQLDVGTLVGEQKIGFAQL